MIHQIMSDLSEYIAAYDRYNSSLNNNRLLNKLTRVYNELLGIAEKYADDYNNFQTALKKNKIEKRFKKEIKRCEKLFKKQLKLHLSS